MTTLRGGRTHRVRATIKLAAAGCLFACAAALLSLADGVAAKTPGRIYCYHGVCHRVRAIVDRAMLVADDMHRARPDAVPLAITATASAVEHDGDVARGTAATPRAPEPAPIAVAARSLAPEAAALTDRNGSDGGRAVALPVAPAPALSVVAALSPPPRPALSSSGTSATRTAVRHDVRAVETAATMMPPWASGKARAYLVVAFTLALATLFLARLRRPDYIAAGLRGAKSMHRMARASEQNFTVAYRRLDGESAPRAQPLQPAVSALARTATLRHARYLIDAGEHAVAEATLRKLLSDLEVSVGDQHDKLAAPLRLWADCARDAGRLADAREIYGRALAVAEAAMETETADILVERARLHLAAREPAMAAIDAARAERLYRACGARGQTVAALLLKAEARHGLGNSAGTEAALREASGIAGADDDICACEVAVGLAHVVSARGAAAEAASLLGTAIAALDRHLGLAPAGHLRVLDPVSDQRAIDGAVHVRRRAIELAATLGVPASHRTLARVL